MLSQILPLRCAFFYGITHEQTQINLILCSLFFSSKLTKNISFSAMVPLLKITFAFDAYKTFERTNPPDHLCKLLYVFCRSAHIPVN